MTTLTVNGILPSAFQNLKGLTEVRDDQGTLLGYLLPPMPHEELMLYLKALAGYDPIEIQRRKDSGCKGRTTHEVLARLQAMEKPTCVTP